MELTERDEARFWSKVALPNEQGCMLWLGCLWDGYGRFKLTGAMRQAHRLSYFLAYGEVPDGLQLDHLCRVRHCVAPLHLEAVTSAENARRGQTVAAANAAKTHCPKGHAYAGENLRVTPAGARRCVTCQRDRDFCRGLHTHPVRHAPVRRLERSGGLMDGWSVGPGDWSAVRVRLTREEVDAALDCIDQETVDRAQAKLIDPEVGE